jgi:hypothetical protein
MRAFSFQDLLIQNTSGEPQGMVRPLAARVNGLTRNLKDRFLVGAARLVALL